MRRVTIALRSGLVGVLATMSDLLVLFLLVSALGLSARLANVPALLFGVAAQFVGNKCFAFQDRSSDWARQGALFLLVEVGALLLNAVLFDRIVIAFPGAYIAVRLLVTMGVYLCFSLPLWSLIFKPTPMPARG